MTPSVPSFRGIFTHGAPWSAASPGRANVGDVVKVVRSPVKPDDGDAGSRDRNISWAAGQAGSARSC